MIIRNAAECRRCGKWLYSRHVHDFRTHSCDDFVWFMVDGGHEYIRRGWGNERTPRSLPEDHYIERSLEINPRIYDLCLKGLQGYTWQCPYCGAFCPGEHVCWAGEKRTIYAQLADEVWG